jgi:hypothetical protein
MTSRKAAQGAYSAAKNDHVERLPPRVTFAGIAPITRRKFKPHGPFTATASVFDEATVISPGRRGFDA